MGVSADTRRTSRGESACRCVPVTGVQLLVVRRGQDHVQTRPKIGHQRRLRLVGRQRQKNVPAPLCACHHRTGPRHRVHIAACEAQQLCSRFAPALKAVLPWINLPPLRDDCEQHFQFFHCITAAGLADSSCIDRIQALAGGGAGKSRRASGASICLWRAAKVGIACLSTGLQYTSDVSEIAGTAGGYVRTD